jgi:hypothetical protein
MEEIQIDSSSKKNSIDMDDLEGSSSGGSTYASHNQGVTSRNSTAMHDDPYADMILSIYKNTV